MVLIISNDYKIYEADQAMESLVGMLASKILMPGQMPQLLTETLNQEPLRESYCSSPS